MKDENEYRGIITASQAKMVIDMHDALLNARMDGLEIKKPVVIDRGFLLFCRDLVSKEQNRNQLVEVQRMAHDKKLSPSTMIVVMTKPDLLLIDCMPYQIQVGYFAGVGVNPDGSSGFKVSGYEHAHLGRPITQDIYLQHVIVITENQTTLVRNMIANVNSASIPVNPNHTWADYISQLPKW